MARERLPVYLNRFPDGRGTLTCAHCAIDAELEGAHATALYAEARTEGGTILWDGDLSAEELLGGAADPCQHLAAYQQMRGS